MSAILAQVPTLRSQLSATLRQATDIASPLDSIFPLNSANNAAPSCSIHNVILTPRNTLPPHHLQCHHGMRAVTPFPTSPANSDLPTSLGDQRPPHTRNDAPERRGNRNRCCGPLSAGFMDETAAAGAAEAADSTAPDEMFPALFF